jgi:hypothetical protein
MLSFFSQFIFCTFWRSYSFIKKSTSLTLSLSLSLILFIISVLEIKNAQGLADVLTEMLSALNPKDPEVILCFHYCSISVQSVTSV